MKKRLVAALLLLCVFATAQKSEQFFDYQWAPCASSEASYYSVIEKKDSLWNRMDYFVHEKSLQMQGSYKDEATNIEEGHFVYYHSNGVLESVGNFKNGKRDGLWVRYYNNRMMYDSVFYDKGTVAGTRLRWHRNGFPMDSSVIREDGSGVNVSWFDNGIPSAAGLYSAGFKMNGKWQFFHRNGKLSAVEIYDDGKLSSKTYYNTDGSIKSDTTTIEKEAEFKGGQKAWQTYLMKNLYFPEQWQFSQDGKAVVMVEWAIDEEGKVVDEQVIGSFHPSFDKIALEVIRRSPKWIPAESHNRKVKTYRRQPVTFAQQ